MPGGRPCTSSLSRRDAYTTCPARVSSGPPPAVTGRSQGTSTLPVLVIFARSIRRSVDRAESRTSIMVSASPVRPNPVARTGRRR